MLKETETEQTVGFVDHIYIIGGISNRALATPMRSLP